MGNPVGAGDRLRLPEKLRIATAGERNAAPDPGRRQGPGVPCGATALFAGALAGRRCRLTMCAGGVRGTPAVMAGGR